MIVERKIFAVTVGAFLFVLGIGLITYFTYNGTRSRSEAYSSADGENNTIPEKPIQVGTEEDLWKNNIRILNIMACTPRLTKVYVKSLLKASDGRKDYTLIPSVIPVPRCNDSYSFCGDDDGIVSGTCQPGNVTEAEFLVKYYPAGQPVFFNVTCQVHSTCECKR